MDDNWIILQYINLNPYPSMTIKQLLENNAGNAEFLSMVCNFINQYITKETQSNFVEGTELALQRTHFGKEEAKCICDSLVIVKNNNVVKGAFLTDEEILTLYHRYKDALPYCNLWDFKVLLNRNISAYHDLFHSWWSNEDKECLIEKYVELTIAWLTRNGFNKQNIKEKLLQN